MSSGVLPERDDVPALLPAEGSLTWRLASDVRALHGAPYALLLQVSHPTVGAGVSEFSEFAKDPWGRLLRTLDYVHGTIYGGPELAADIGRRVRGIHKDIKGVKPDGRRYHALEPEAYAWVHATLAIAIVNSHRQFGRALSERDAETFWLQWRPLGRLVGVRDRDLPETWRDFGPYFDAIVRDVLERTAAVDEVLATLAAPAPPPIPGLPPALWRLVRAPAARHARLVTAGMLGPELRGRFGLGWSQRQDRVFRALGAASRAAGPLMIGPLGSFGPYYVRWRRKALDRGDVAGGRPRQPEVTAA